jgi:hypothetical protein
MELRSIQQAARWDTLIQQGSTFSRTLLFEVDISNVTFRGQLRRSHGDDVELASFTCVPLNAETLLVFLTPAETSALPAERLVFDIEAFTPGDAAVARILEGVLRVTPEVTR